MGKVLEGKNSFREYSRTNYQFLPEDQIEGTILEGEGVFNTRRNKQFK
jgi:hypothetical protein